MTRWLIAGERDRSEWADRQELPVVYRDAAVGRILETLATLVVATAESRQAQTCAELLTAFASLAPRLASSSDVAVFERSLDRVLPSVIQQATRRLLPKASDEPEAAHPGIADDDAGRRGR